MFFPRTVSERTQAVLALSSTEVEWLDYDSNGNPRYARIPVEGEGVADFVRAALAARAQAGGALVPVVLALREGLVKQGLVELPALTKRELGSVMARKAARALGDPELPPLYSCIEHAAVGGSGGAKWTFAAMERGLIRALVMSLRSAGISTSRITSEDLAALDHAREHEVEEGTGTICVAIGPGSIQVSLICGDDLHIAETLEGDLENSPHLVSSLLQSVKTTGGFWRRTQRGSRVRAIVIVGLSADRRELLGNALRVAVPEAEVVKSLDATDPSESADHSCSGRIESLEACLLDGPFTPKLSFALPARRRWVALGVCAAILLAAPIVSSVSTDVDTRVAGLEKVIGANKRVTDELANIERSRTKSIGDLLRVTSTLDRTEELLQSGLEYDLIVREVLFAFGERASIVNLAVGPETGGFRDLSVRAVAVGDAVSAIQGIGDLERDLARIPFVHDVLVDLPSQIDGSKGTLSLEFAVRSKLEFGS